MVRLGLVVTQYIGISKLQVRGTFYASFIEKKNKREGGLIDLLKIGKKLTHEAKKNVMDIYPENN